MRNPERAEGLVKYPREKVPVVFRRKMKLCALTRRVRVEVGLSINRCRRTWVSYINFKEKTSLGLRVSAGACQWKLFEISEHGSRTR